MNLVKGTLDVLVLRALTWSAMHGFEITEWLVARSAGALEVEEGALYHALIRLEERGAIEAEWGITENGRRARYYSLTPQGKRELRSETKRLLAYTAALHAVLAEDAR
jgi:transcriptional regulator